MGQHVRQVVIKAVMFELRDKMLLHSSTPLSAAFYFGACGACVSATQEGDIVERVCLLHRKVMLHSSTSPYCRQRFPHCLVQRPGLR